MTVRRFGVVVVALVAAVVAWPVECVQGSDDEVARCSSAIGWTPPAWALVLLALAVLALAAVAWPRRLQRPKTAQPQAVADDEQR
ncbi:hypothetical protein [Angustibacter aerolatus]|uniref:Secreted protein n=1 Tax=Angustibacter aerolatus TaxID=1162965 RepID=A0ABQ6JQ79_9ACTN|nr:hypothetical protein [Angustibacter aerolatus]GMA88870.1 hypothetical protein GCM10025868_41200 [Angustibacter aerolatus]